MPNTDKVFPDGDPTEDDGFRYNSYPLGDLIDVADASLPAQPPDTGDFHAAFSLSDGTVALVMGDVIGHGQQASAHAMVLRDAIGGCLKEGLEPGEALGFVNAAAEMSPEFDGFATAFVATINPGTGVLTYASGGHEPAMVADPSAGQTGDPTIDAEAVVELDRTGPPLGVLGGDEVQYEQHTTHISAGASLLLYTDGVTEARRGRELLGPDRLRKFLTRHLSLHPLRIVRKIVGYARAFTGQGRKLRDDAALLLMRRRIRPRISRAKQPGGRPARPGFLP